MSETRSRSRAPKPSGIARHGRLHTPLLMRAATIALVGLTVAIAVFAGPIYDLSERAAQGLLDPAPYVEAVIP